MPYACRHKPAGMEFLVIRRGQVFPAKLSEFNRIKSLVEEFAAAAKLFPEDGHKLTLIVEELFTNTVRHGHRGDSEQPVHVALADEAAGITLTYIDTAPEYDSLAAAMRTDLESTVRQRQIGGIGVALTFALADSAHYTYQDGKNTIVIRLRGARAPR
jgi:serine/threonine-protein kinase RsbW